MKLKELSCFDNDLDKSQIKFITHFINNFGITDKVYLIEDGSETQEEIAERIAKRTLTTQEEIAHFLNEYWRSASHIAYDWGPANNNDDWELADLLDFSFAYLIQHNELLKEGWLFSEIDLKIALKKSIEEGNDDFFKLRDALAELNSKNLKEIHDEFDAAFYGGTIFLGFSELSINYYMHLQKEASELYEEYLNLFGLTRNQVIKFCLTEKLANLHTVAEDKVEHYLHDWLCNFRLFTEELYVEYRHAVGCRYQKSRAESFIKQKLKDLETKAK